MYIVYKYIIQYYLFMTPFTISDCFQTQFLSVRSVLDHIMIHLQESH